MRPPARAPARSRALLAAVAVVTLAVIPGARASGSPLVDAGWSFQADAGVPFPLEARLEPGSGDVAVAWSPPEGCAVDTADALITSATCPSGGLKTFSVTASNSEGTATDEVAIVVLRETTVPILHATGDVALGLPDEFTTSGSLDAATTSFHLDVPGDAAWFDVTLDWGSAANDLDLEVRADGGSSLPVSIPRMIAKPETVTVDGLEPGQDWVASVQPKRSGPESWTLDAVATTREGFDLDIPTIVVPRVSATPGEDVTLFAEPAGGTEPYEVTWETDPGSIAFDDGTGDSLSFTFAAPTTVRAKVRDAVGFESVANAFVRGRGPVSATPRPVTVVAVVDNGFFPYHYDFVGHQHPWNTDEDPGNDFDFEADPASYIPGYPTDAQPIRITLPESPDEAIASYPTTLDAAEWGAVQPSDSEETHLYRIPGTKVIAAIQFGEPLIATSATHGTRSSASSAGNIHGTCPECLLVLITGGSDDGLRWAAAQPWIDVVTNSYGASLSGGVVRDNMYLDGPVTATRDASEAGQTIVFSAGNGIGNGYDVPQLTYWSSEKGPDWMITVGAVNRRDEQSYFGHGKPVDISSIGTDYPSTGGSTATGTGTHSGTSNAAPVVAGYFGEVLQRAREDLDDVTPLHEDGVVASGASYACGESNPSCALGDGVLTRAEWQDLVLLGVSPTPSIVSVGTTATIPTTQYAYYYQGHGTVSGRSVSDADYEDEWGRMVSIARGTAPPMARPDDETTWFQVDSFCRQRLWGTWNGGYYAGIDPAPDAVEDPMAFDFMQWCGRVEQDTLKNLGDD